MEYSNNLFQQLKDLPKQGIYCLKYSNNIHIGYSSNLPLSLINNLNNNNLVTNDYEFELLETVTDKLNLFARAQYYKDRYSNLGYNLINPKVIYNRKLKVGFINDFRHVPNGECLIVLKIVSRGYEELIVGVFNTYHELEEFSARFYNNTSLEGGRVYNVIFADNNLTKEYLNRDE